MKNKKSIRQDKFEPSEDGIRHARDAKAVVQLVVAIEAITRPINETILYHLIWQITTAHGKYHTRYRSASVINDASDSEEIRHEHVWPIKWLINELLKEGACVEDVLDKAVGCVVTKAESLKLNKFDLDKQNDAVGWERYQLTGIEVYDMSTVPPRKLGLSNSSVRIVIQAVRNHPNLS